MRKFWAIPLFSLFFLLAAGSLLADSPANQGFSMELADADSVWNTIRTSGSNAVLVNMWATWCQPCREEMPDLLKLHDTYTDKGFTLLLVSADFVRSQKQAEDYLKSLGVDFPTLLKDQKDMQFINGLHQEWSGALPFSMLVDREGNVVKTWEGKSTFEEFEKSLLPLLNTP